MKLAELLIEMRANTAQLNRNLSEARESVNKFADHVKWRLENIGISLGAFGIADAVKHLVDYEDQIKHTAEATGMSVEKFTELSEALKIYDVSQEGATQALAYFDKILSGLVRSKAGVTGLKELGLSLQELQKLSPHEALLKVADAFSRLKDGTNKAGIAAALFENTYGLQLIPFLNRGSKGIEELEGRFSGLADSQAEATMNAEAMKEQWQELSASLTELGAKLLLSGSWLSDAFKGISHPLITMDSLFAEMAELIYKIPLAFLQAENSMAHFLGSTRTGFKTEIADLQGHIAEWEGVKTELAKQMGLGNAPESPSRGGAEAGPTASPAADKAASYLMELKRQLVGLGQGDVAKGIQHLKDLGATEKELAEGRELLGQIEELKEAKKWAESFAAAQEKMAKAGEHAREVEAAMIPTTQEIAAALEKTDMASISAGRSALNLGKSWEEVIRAQAMAAAGGNSAGFGLGGIPMPQVHGILNKIKFDMAGLNEISKKWGDQMSNSMIRIIETGQNFKSLLQDLIREFETFLLKKFVFAEIAQAFGGSSGLGGIIGSFFGGLAGGRAAGGPVTEGELYMVGESGPELFAPGSNGSIIPHGASVRGGNQTTYNIDARGADAGVEHRIMRALEAAQKKTLAKSLVLNYEYQARGGTL